MLATTSAGTPLQTQHGRSQAVVAVPSPKAPSSFWAADEAVFSDRSAEDRPIVLEQEGISAELAAAFGAAQPQSSSVQILCSVPAVRISLVKRERYRSWIDCHNRADATDSAELGPPAQLTGHLRTALRS